MKCARGYLIAPVALAIMTLGSSGAVDERVDDSTFVKKACSAGMTEVKAGEMAIQKATDAKVKSFARRMIEDHSKANKELEALVTRKGWTASKTIDEQCQKELDKLSATDGKGFDRVYMENQLKAHEEAVKLFQKESESGQDPDLKAWAAKTLPTLQEHLRMAKETHEGAGR